MTSDDFRALALGFPEATEAAHMSHPDFRVRGKIFATLGYPTAEWGVVKLTFQQQQAYTRAEPEAFAPVKGTWGARGMTMVRLRAARKPSVRKALDAAWCNVAPKALVRERG